MKTLAIILAASLVGTAAFADTTVIRKETEDGDKTIVKTDRPDGGTVERRSIDTTGSVGCETKSVTKTDEDGDSVTKSRTRC